jgi:RNA polymerase sigma factor (sigma-70 family)
MSKEATQNESALVCAARDGDKKALEVLITRHWAWLKAIVYGVLKRQTHMDDVLQDICVKVIDKIHTLREPECFRPWLASLARRHALTYISRMGKAPQALADDWIDQTYDKAMPTVVDSLIQQEEYERVMQAVHALPDKYREVFLMQYASNLTYRNLPLTTVQIRLVRARRMILDAVTQNDEQRTPES